MAIPLIASLASAAIQGVTSIAAARAANEQRKELDRQRRERLAAWAREYRPLTKSSNGQATMNYASEQANKLWNKSEGSASVANKSEEASAQDKATAVEMIPNTAANMASQEEQHRMNIGQAMDNIVSDYNTQTNKKNDEKTANIIAAGSAAANGLSAIASSIGSGSSSSTNATTASTTANAQEKADKLQINANKLQAEADKLNEKYQGQKDNLAVNITESKKPISDSEYSWLKSNKYVRDYTKPFDLKKSKADADKAVKNFRSEWGGLE